MQSIIVANNDGLVMRAVFRVDSSTAIGSGHLMRCLTLTEQLRKEKNAEVHFISRDLDGNLHGKIREKGFILHVLPRHAPDASLSGYATWLTVSQNVDAEETKAILREIGKVNCLVVDSYALDAVWERKMRPFADEIFVIDDLANREHDCDVLLDQNFYLDMEKRYLGLVPEKCKLLLGPRHALLREEFYKARRQLKNRGDAIKHILVFYGGSDLTNETMKAVRALVELSLPRVTADVIVGAGNPHKTEVEAFCREYGFLHYHEQVDNMAELMAKADLALGAGGATTWERCFLELPTIVTSVAANQKKIAEDCAAVGYITYLGRAETVTESQIVSALNAATKEHLLEQTARMRTMFEDGETAYGALFA